MKLTWRLIAMLMLMLVFALAAGIRAED